MQADSAERYGTITRLLHWIIAIGLAWMLFTAVLHLIDKDSVMSRMFFPWHPQVGFTLLILGVMRLIWFAISYQKRPKPYTKWSRLGHWALYLLVVITPAIALLRQYGSDRPFKYLGIDIMYSIGEKTAWMVDLGNLLHSKFGWLLFILIFGHTMMAFRHRKSKEAYLFRRMVG